MAPPETGRDSPGHSMNVLERRDVEDYASGRLMNCDLVNLVEEALLEDEAARDVLRQKLRERGGDGQGRSLQLEALQDLCTAAHSCRALEEMYGRLSSEAKDAAVSRFLEGRRAAFRRAGEMLARPLQEQPSDIPDTMPEQTVLLARESRESLSRQLREEPAAALGALEELHRLLMMSLRTLIHMPWPLETKLLIADAYAQLRDELESGAWHLRRRAAAH